MTAGKGHIVGDFLELEPDSRIVQTWRAADFPEGHESRLELESEPTADGTFLRMTHFGVPEEMREQISEGWQRHYCEPMRRYLQER